MNVKTLKNEIQLELELNALAQPAVDAARDANAAAGAASNAAARANAILNDIDAAKDSLVNEITEAAQEQQEEIRKTGEQVLASLPEDYTALSGEVSSLKDHKADGILDTSARAETHTLHAQQAPLGVTLYGATAQEGKGDPSISNVRPIRNTLPASVRAGGKNLFFMPPSFETFGSQYGLTVAKNADGSYTINGTATGTFEKYVKDFYMALSLGTYTFSNVENVPFTVMGLPAGDDPWPQMKLENKTSVTLVAKYPKVYNQLYLHVKAGTVFNNFRLALQFEIGQVATDYEPYNANVAEIPLSSPLYGNNTVYDTVETDVLVGGENRCRVVRRWAKIESYAGETLPGAWVSDRDVYRSGTTPTAGATVIYQLETPIVTLYDPVKLCPPHGVKPVTVAGSYDTSVKYIHDVKEYVDKNTGNIRGFDTDKYVHVSQMLFTGETDGMTKDNAVTLSFRYRGAKNYMNNDSEDTGKREDVVVYTGYAKVKWQGTSSINFPKKNYTVTFYSDAECTTKMPITLRTKWGAQSKYCMKANFIDPSQCRNVIAAKLWGQCVLSRPTDSISYQEMHDLPNAGAIDGYPILTTINGEYVGMYTMNIPKDEWMFGMKDGEGVNTVLCGEVWNNATGFRAPALVDGTDWAYEVEPADKSWVTASFNKIYAALSMDEGNADAIAAKKAALDACVDIYSVLDYDIYTKKICATDNTGKNQLLVTYDGVHWIMSAYDLDTAFGVHWGGAKYYNANRVVNGNNLTDTVRRLYTAEYNARISALTPILSATNVCEMVDNFLIDVPEEAFVQEAKLWPDMAGANTNAINQIKTFMMLRNV